MTCTYDLQHRHHCVTDDTGHTYPIHFRVAGRNELTIVSDCPCAADRCRHVRVFVWSVLAHRYPYLTSGVSKNLANLKLTPSCRPFA